MTTTQSTLAEHPPRPRDCPHCGANCWDDDETCWHCRRKLASPPARPRLIQFSLGLLLVLITTIAVGLGMARWVPIVPVLLLFWIVPAFLHAYLACRLLRGRVPPVQLGERLDRFGLGLVIALLASLVGLGVGWAAALVLWTVLPRDAAAGPQPGPAPVFLPSIFGIAGLCGLVAGGWILWITLPRPPERDG